MSNFDPYSIDNIAGGGDEWDGISFGEVVFYEGYQGIRVPDSNGKKPVKKYDPNDDTHKALVANGAKIFVYYDVQWLPHGVTWEARVNNLTNFSKEWKAWAESIADLLNVEVKSPEFKTWFDGWIGGSIYAKWSTEIVEVNGWKNYIRRALELYPDLRSCVAAYDAHKGIDGQVDKVPSGTQVEALPKDQALPFVQSLANQVAKANEGICDPEKLQEAIDSMPMLGDLTVDDPDVQAIIKATGVPF